MNKDKAIELASKFGITITDNKITVDSRQTAETAITQLCDCIVNECAAIVQTNCEFGDQDYNDIMRHFK